MKDEDKPKDDEKDSPLWVVFHNADGREYYYNTMTGTTQWTAPSDFELSSSNRSEVKEKDKKKVKKKVKKKDTTNNRSEVKKKELTASNNDSEVQDPWQCFQNDEGVNYYYNTTTGESQWEKPTDDAAATTTTGATPTTSTSSNMKNSNTVKEKDSDTAATSTEKEKNDSVTIESIPASSSNHNDDNSTSNDKWIVLHDRNRRDYTLYVNTRTGKTQWEKPDLPAGANDKYGGKNRKQNFFLTTFSNTNSSKQKLGGDFFARTPSGAELSQHSKATIKSKSELSLDELKDKDDETFHASNSSHFNETNQTISNCFSDKTNSTIDFLDDDPSTMTYSRRIALCMMNRYKWYNPRLEGPGHTNCKTSSRSALDETFDSDEYDGKDDCNHNNNENDDRNPQTTDGHFRSKEVGHPIAVTPTNEEASLEKAWAFFEHVVLPRHIVHDVKQESSKTTKSRFMEKLFKKGEPLDIAEPGENQYNTKLYHPFFTPHSQLGDFGIGCGVYFSTLRAFCILTFLAGILNLPTMLFYSSDEYGVQRHDITGIKGFQLKASAVCMDFEWIVCDDCYVSSSFPGDRVRFINETNTTTEEYDIPVLRFARRNDCHAATMQNGMINLATVAFVAVGILIINKMMSRAEIAFDIDEQTAQDYSILIDNPPADAYSPDEWKNFFENNFEDVHVTCCTIGIDNDMLIRDLVNRRTTMKRLEMMVEPGTSLDMLTLAGVSAEIQQDRGRIDKFMKNIIPGIPELHAKIAALNARIKGLVQLTYPVTKVFITFETERAQRQVLKALSVGKFQAMRNNTKVVQNKSYLFRGKNVLYITEPDEPNTIRWKHLNAKETSRVKEQLFTAFVTIAAIIFVISLTDYVNSRTGPFVSAMCIASANVGFPFFGYWLVNFEKHPSESDRQASLYWKCAIFRWMNTVAIYTIITPFNSTIDFHDGIILRVRDLFIAQMLFLVGVQVFDVDGHFFRHFLAPRARTQDEMNIYMCGGFFEFDLAERYTNITNFLLLALWYSSIFPAGLFMCSLTLFLNYYLDRFSLMRTWKKPLNLGSEMSTLNRKYLFPLCIFGMAFPSSYFWSAFPYDNLCSFGTIGERNDYTSEYLTMGEYGNGTITNIPPHNYEYVKDPAENITVHITNDTVIYEHCFQDFLRTTGRSKFPFVSSNQKSNNIWMTPEQEMLTDIYGWATVGIIIAIGLLFVFYTTKYIWNFFRGSYKEHGEDQGINFSEVESKSTYVPQANNKVYPYPLLASNIDKIDPDLLEWTDIDRPHAFYDLTLDAKMLTAGLKEFDDKRKSIQRARRKHVFDKIYHWPPPNVKKNV